MPTGPTAGAMASQTVEPRPPKQPPSPASTTDHRPAIVDHKTRFGDWELDTVIGPNHRGVLVTITERSTQLPADETDR